MSEKILRLKRNVLKKVAPLLVSFLVKLLYKTIRWEIIGLENIKDKEGPFVFSFFHGRMMMLAFLYPYIKKSECVKMILSPHFDGEIGSLIAEKFGIDSIKGSSSKGSLKLLKEINKIKNCDIAITPDGPRGPFHKVKNGVIYISKITGYPIIPLSYSVSKGKRLKSWDKFLIPFPFSKGVYIIGKPFFVPQSLDKSNIESLAKSLEEEMIKIENIADMITGLRV